MDDKELLSMSGICGVVQVEGSPHQLPSIIPMLGVLERRGPERTDQWQSRNASLGHTLLATTPEAETERLPLQNAAGDLTITADARIDNRDELFEKLGVRADARIGDGELILRAYREWGSECPKHLLGDFAFAIWDANCSRLFCARDQLGMRQLLYANIANFPFTFATEAEAIIALDPKRFPLNKDRIADYLENRESASSTRTFYEAVQRLPPAHSLILNAAGLTLERYWTLTPGGQLNLPSDKAYEEAFLSVFREAVSCRLRSNSRVGAMLSGGIDSNSVVAIASRLLAEDGKGPLLTFSGTGPDAEACAETRGVAAANQVPGIQSHQINYAEIDELLPELVDGLKSLAEPFDGHMNMIRAVYETARRSGVKAVLDGAAADVILTPGDTLGHYVVRNDWSGAAEHLRGLDFFWGPGPPHWKEFLAALWRVYVPAQLRRIRRRYLDWLSSSQGSKSPDDRDRPQLFINPPTRAGDRKSRFWADQTRVRAATIANPVLSVGRERYDRVASAFAIEPRDPFMDLRVVKFCLSLPLDQVQARGWPKVILRRAMEAQVPDAIRWRRGREHVGWRFTQAIFEKWDEWQDMDLDILARYGCSTEELERVNRDQKTGRFSQSITKLIYLRFLAVSAKGFATGPYRERE